MTSARSTPAEAMQREKKGLEKGGKTPTCPTRLNMTQYEDLFQHITTITGSPLHHIQVAELTRQILSLSLRSVCRGTSQGVLHCTAAERVSHSCRLVLKQALAIDLQDTFRDGCVFYPYDDSVHMCSGVLFMAKLG